MAINVSELDTERFGIAIARTHIASDEDIITADAFCRNNTIRMLIARCEVANIAIVQNMEEAGYRLMDTLIYMRFDCTQKPPTTPAEGYIVRAAKDEDIAGIKAVAQDAFAQYKSGHHYNDPLLDKNKCSELYTDWAYRSLIAKDGMHHSFVAVDKASGQVVGFVCTHEKEQLLDAHLVGVSKVQHRRGIGTALYSHAISFAAGHNKSHVITSTQLSNKASLGMWSRMEFEMYHAEYTFHKWYD